MLVGRENDVDWMCGLLEGPPQLAPGQMRLVQMDGAIGVGKSATLAATLIRVRRGPRVPCNSAGGNNALPPRLHLVYGDRLHGDAPLVPFRTLIEDVLGGGLEDLLNAASPVLLGARCAEVLGTGAAPVILAIDDSQWLDAASEAFTASLIQNLLAVPFTVVVVHRPGQEPRQILEAARRRGAFHEVLTLDPLAEEAISRIASDLPAGQREAVVEAAQGNPLFARTATAVFRRNPEAERVDEVLRLAPGSQMAILAAAVAEDLEVLSQEARTTLEVFALLHPNCRADGVRTAEEVEALAGLEPSAVRSAISELSDRGLLTESSYESLHPVVRISVYENMDAERRTHLHRRAAQRPGTDLFDQADHLARAAPVMTKEEAEVLISAAELVIGAEPAAALDWLGTLAPDQHTDRSELLLSRALILTGRTGDAVARLRVVGSHPGKTEARVLLAKALRITGDMGEARALLAASESV